MKRTALIATLATVAALGLSACGGGGDPLKSDSGGGSGSGGVVVGSANFPENALLAEIYAGALNAAGVKASTKLNIGSREAYIPGIQDGSIDVLPEYTGNLRLYFCCPESKGPEAVKKYAKASDAEGVYQELKAVVPDGLEVLDYAQAEDKDAVVVTQDTADKYSLQDIGDLAGPAKDLTLGGPPEWKTRFTGIPGLKSVYGVEFGDFIETDPGGPLTLKALEDGRVDAGNLFTTDPNIAAQHLVVLGDPKSLFAAQNVVPLIRKDADTAKVKDTLNKVSAQLDTDTLGALVSQVVIDKKDPADVAQEFLAQAGLD
jgi:osmoprotectant transport system substrate-binding protein